MTQNTKARIVDAARDLFVESGEAAVTMRAVAKAAGVSTMAAYRHFDGRDALVVAVMEQGHDKFLASMHRALSAPTPLDRLVATGKAYLDFALANPRDYDLMFLRPAACDMTGTPQTWRDAATFRFVVDRVSECIAAGILPPGDAELGALSLWAHVHGMISLFLTHKLQLEEPVFREVYGRVLAAAWQIEPAGGVSISP